MIEFVLTGCPPNWSNQRSNPYKRASDTKSWLEYSERVATQARLLAGLSPATKGQRFEVYVLLRRLRLLDEDNAYSSVKPVIDGLKAFRKLWIAPMRKFVDTPSAGLIWDDRPAVCRIHVSQQQIKGGLKESTIVRVESR